MMHLGLRAPRLTTHHTVMTAGGMKTRVKNVHSLKTEKNNLTWETYIMQYKQILEKFEQDTLLKKQKTSHVVFTNITIGLQLAITVLIFVYGGYRIDLHFDKSPLFVSIGTVMGMVLGFYHLMKELNAENAREKRNKKDEHKKVRWM